LDVKMNLSTQKNINPPTRLAITVFQVTPKCKYIKQTANIGVESCQRVKYNKYLLNKNCP